MVISSPSILGGMENNSATPTTGTWFSRFGATAYYAPAVNVTPVPAKTTTEPAIVLPHRFVA